MGPVHEATLSGSNSPPLGCLYHCSELYSGCKSLRSAPWSAPVSRSPDWSQASSSQCSTLCTAPVALLLFPLADPSSCITIHGFVISTQTHTNILPHRFRPQLLRHNTYLCHLTTHLHKYLTTTLHTPASASQYAALPYFQYITTPLPTPASASQKRLCHPNTPSHQYLATPHHFKPQILNHSSRFDISPHLTNTLPDPFKLQILCHNSRCVIPSHLLVSISSATTV